MSVDQELMRLIEALLMVADHPMSPKELCEVVGMDLKPSDVPTVIDELNRIYEETNRSFRIRKIANGYRIFVLSEFSSWIRKLYSIYRQERLSRAALETLAIIAYRQPITKVEIEQIRGVACDGVIKGLFEKGLIKIEGRKEVPGRPFLYATTEQFLDYFGLGSLDELPKLEEFEHVLGELTQEEVDLGLGEVARPDRGPGSEDSRPSEPQGQVESEDRAGKAQE